QNYLKTILYYSPNKVLSFSAKASPLKSLAIIFPSGSIRKLRGMAEMRYFTATSLPHPFKSLTCVHFNPSFLIASSQSSRSSSSETPRIVKFLSLYFSKTFTRKGFSLRQGPHQLAQKSTNTYLPLNCARDTIFPAVSVCEKSNAVSPTALKRASSIA